jgi:hypothetical protein
VGLLLHLVHQEVVAVLEVLVLLDHLVAVELVETE